MHGNILYLFEFWADPVVIHLLLLKSSMARLTKLHSGCLTSRRFGHGHETSLDQRDRIYRALIIYRNL